MIIINKKIDFHLLKFPIIFPILYAIVLYLLPEYEKILIYFTIFLLAETHFGSTWPFFLDKINQTYIANNKLKLIILPMFIILLSIIGFFFYKATFILIFYLINVYHVTRQSYGVSKLFIRKTSELIFTEYTIYFFNFCFFLVGLLRFYTGTINNDDLILLNLFITSMFIVLITISVVKFKFSENTLIMITGWIIFYPVCFVDKSIHVILMGVTMHFTQYLVLTFKVTKARMLNEKNLISNSNLNKINKFLIIIFFYSIMMTYLSSLGSSGELVIQNLILIPIIGQMFHFYIDSQLWKFSEKHNRENVLKHLF